MQRNRARSATRFFEDTRRPALRMCEHPGCTAEGEHRAPKGRDRLNEYFWFCLDHVRAYNASWDYYAGMTTEQIEAETRRDTTWQRPSWPLGYWQAQEKFLRERAAHGFGFTFGGESGRGPGDEQAPRRPAARTPEEDALVVLDLAPPVDFPRIKARYRELVKIHHPDANGGNRDAEEKLKVINQAYNTLKGCYGV